jgi:hypothetical protein
VSQLDPRFEPVEPEKPRTGELDERFKPVTQGATGTTQEEEPWSPSGDPYSTDRLKMFGGVSELVFSSATTGVAEVYAGIAGLLSLTLSGGDMDHAKKRVEHWQNVFTWEPKSEGAQHILRQAMPYLSRADVAINDYAAKKATYIDEEGKERIDPLVATAIKTGIWTSVDIAAFAVPGAKAVLAKHHLRQMRKQVIKEADRLGIRLTQEDFADDVAAAAREIGSESAGEQAVEYTEALRQAERSAKDAKKSAYAAAAAEDLYVETSPVRRLGYQIIRDLDKDYNLDADGIGMQHVRAVLDDMTGKHSRKPPFGSGTGLEVGRNMAVHFSKIEKFRKDINRRIRAAKKNPEYATGASALIEIQKRLDNWLVEEFNKAAIADGRIISSGQALSGSSSGLDAYLGARRAAGEHAWFTEIKAIADLLQKDASVDQVAHWIIGSSRKGKTGAATTVERIKVILGDDHPAFEALRQDFIFQLTKPLLSKDGPNFKAFYQNYEYVLMNNKPLADAFGLDQSDVKILADFARTAAQLPTAGSKKARFYTAKELVQTIARLGVGSDVAKGAARVGFATKVGNLIFGVDRVSPGQVTGAVVDARFDQPWIPRGGPVYAAIIAGAAMSGSVNDAATKSSTRPQENGYERFFRSDD